MPQFSRKASANIVAEPVVGSAAAVKQREDDDDGLTEEERVAARRRCLRTYDLLLLLTSGSLCGGSLYAASALVIDTVSPAVLLAAAGSSGALFAVNVIGIISIWGENVRARVLLTYFTCVVVLCFASLGIGGFCFILTQSAVSYLQNNWTQVLSNNPTNAVGLTLQHQISVTTAAMYGTGVASLILFLLCAGAINNAIHVLTPTRAYTIFLQSINLALLPVGAALIAAAVYVADTSVGGQVAIAAFALFVLGMIVVVLLLLGCAGTSLQSRGLMHLFLALTFLASFGFISFGALALIEASVVADFITSQWSVIRQVLPPTFSGTYDQAAFGAFVNANLTSVGFLSVVTALLLVSQTWASMRLRSEIKFEQELEQEAWQAVKEGLIDKEIAQQLSASTTHSRAQLAWKQAWTKGTRRTRCAIRAGCCALGVLIVVAVTLAALALYYSTSCVALGQFGDTYAYGPAAFSAAAGQAAASLGPFVCVYSAYSRGLTSLQVDPALTAAASVSLTYHKAAYKASMAVGGWPLLSNRSVLITAGAGGAAAAAGAMATATSSVDVLGTGVGSVIVGQGITAVAQPPTAVLGYDVSCQNDQLAVAVPTAQVYAAGAGNSRLAGDAYPLALEFATASGGNSLGAISVDVSATPLASRPRLRWMNLTTEGGYIEVIGALVGSKGLAATTTVGAVTLSQVAAQCDPADIGTGQGGVRATTVQGSISVDALASVDCDVVLAGSAALTSVTGASVANTLGGGLLSLTGAQGLMTVSSSAVQVLEITGDTGTVQASAVNVSEAMRVATSSGSVSLQLLALATRGVLQVETTSGAISVSTATFAGLVSIITGGPINCVTTGLAAPGANPTGFTNPVNPCAPTAGGSASGGQTLTVVDGVQVNCAAAACPYLAQMTITSMTGSVTLTVAPN